MFDRKKQAITAYHEAGHAVLAMANGFAVTEISNDLHNPGQGYVRYLQPKNPSATDRIRLAVVCAAGSAADYLHWDLERRRLGLEGNDELCEGNLGDQRDSEAHLLEIGDSGWFWDYVGVAMYLMKKPEIWHFIEQFGEIMQRTPLINGVDVLRNAFEVIPKIDEKEIVFLREQIVVRQPRFT